MSARPSVTASTPRWTAGGRSATRSTPTSWRTAGMATGTRSCSSTAPSTPTPPLLQLAQVGFLPADDPRIIGTVRAIRAELEVAPGLLRRYRTERTDDGVAGDEHAFLACSFWLADALARVDDVDAATEVLDILTGLANDVGLLAEQYDPVGRRMAGNMPQALSHLALVRAVHSHDLAVARREAAVMTPTARDPVRVGRPDGQQRLPADLRGRTAPGRRRRRARPAARPGREGTGHLDAVVTTHRHPDHLARSPRSSRSRARRPGRAPTTPRRSTRRRTSRSPAACTTGTS